MRTSGRRVAPDGGIEQRTSASGLRAGGGALALGSALFVAGLALHPPPSSDTAAFMALIVDGPVRWQAAHALTALGLFAVTAASLVVLTAGSRRTRRAATRLAWATLAVGALWVTTAALVEATVVTALARSGDLATFEAWQLFAQVHSAAFLAIAGALVVIAAAEARSPAPATPGWAATVATLAAAVAFVAYLVGVGLGVDLAGPVWLVSTIVVGLWSLWFGVGLVRTSAPLARSAEDRERAGGEVVP